MDEELRKRAKDALSEIGSVFVDKTLPGHPVTELDLGRGAELVTDELADLFQCFPEIRSLYLDLSTASDKLLESLRFFPRLRHLNLSESLVTDAGLKNLGYVPCMETLILGCRFSRVKMHPISDISDQAIKYILCLTSLKTLDIHETAITDEGVVAVRALKNLEYLALNERQVTLKSVASLKELSKLNTVAVWGPGSLHHPAVLLVKNELPHVKIDC